MGNFARSLGLARVTPVVGGYGFGSPHSLGGAIPVISSDPWIARRGAQHVAHASHPEPAILQPNATQSPPRRSDARA